MIDAHCHLDNPQFQTIPEIANLETVITAGSNLASSKRCVKLAHKFANVYATVGLGYEPKYKNWSNLSKELLRLVQDKKVVGIGECGLDVGSPAEEELLKFHLQLAQATNLPLIIHNRRQDEKLLKIIGEFPKVMIHCFTSDLYFMQECMQRGWYVSFGGILTFKKSDYLRAVAAQVPAEKLLIETDAPYLTPEPVRGDRNSPTNVKIIADMLAEIRGVAVAEIDRITTQNTRNLFRL